MSKVFISYSSSDKRFARSLASDIVELGHEAWLDEWQIKVGDCILTKIEHGITEANYVIIVLSKAAVKSGWVDREWKTKYWDEIARERILVLPVLFEDCEIPPLLRSKRYADFRSNYATGLVHLMNAINQYASIPAPLLSNLHSLGIKQIHRERNSIRFIDYMSAVEDASEIKILGIALTEFTNGVMRRRIEQKLRVGCKLKIMWLDPDSEYSEQRAAEEKKSYKNLKEYLQRNAAILKTFRCLFPDDFSAQIELGYYNSPPRYFMFITNTIMVVGLYLREKLGIDSPFLELSIQDGGLYVPFLEHFNSLWNDKSTVIIERDI